MSRERADTNSVSRVLDNVLLETYVLSVSKLQPEVTAGAVVADQKKHFSSNIFNLNTKMLALTHGLRIRSIVPGFTASALDVNSLYNESGQFLASKIDATLNDGEYVVIAPIFDISIEKHVGTIVLDNKKKEIVYIDAKDLNFMTDNLQRQFNAHSKFKSFKFRSVRVGSQQRYDSISCGHLTAESIMPRVIELVKQDKYISLYNLTGNFLRRSFDHVYGSTKNTHLDRLNHFTGLNMEKQYCFLMPLIIVQSVVRLVAEWLPKVVEEFCRSTRERIARAPGSQGRFILKNTIITLLHLVETVMFSVRVLLRTVTAPVSSMKAANETRLALKKTMPNAGNFLGGTLMFFSAVLSVASIAAITMLTAGASSLIPGAQVALASSKITSAWKGFETTGWLAGHLFGAKAAAIAGTAAIGGAAAATAVVTSPVMSPNTPSK